MVESSEFLVEMRDVCKRYPNFNLSHFNLNLPRGEILGLVGPNGAGKSTILKLMMGFIRADSGEIQMLGRPMPQEEVTIKQYVAYVAEDMRLYASQTIAWHMQFVGGFFPSWDQKYATHINQRFDLNAHQKIKELSLGQRIKTTLMLAMARRPKILVLDEPSTGLDPVARHELTSELCELMLNEDNSVIFSSQFTQDIERLSDTIAFLDQGELISYADKESYLDRWRRVELTVQNPRLEMTGLVFSQTIGSLMTVVDSEYSEEKWRSFNQQGVEVVRISNMSLEEIFIDQVLHRRQLARKENAHVPS